MDADQGGNMIRETQDPFLVSVDHAGSPGPLSDIFPGKLTDIYPIINSTPEQPPAIHLYSLLVNNGM